MNSSTDFSTSTVFIHFPFSYHLQARLDFMVHNINQSLMCMLSSIDPLFCHLDKPNVKQIRLYFLCLHRGCAVLLKIITPSSRHCYYKLMALGIVAPRPSRLSKNFTMFPLSVYSLSLQVPF